MSDAAVLVECPKCGAQQEDYDGFGVVFCPVCRFCKHPSVTDGICDMCGQWEAGRPPWPRTVHLKAYSEAEWARMRMLATWKPCVPPENLSRLEQEALILNSYRDRDNRPHIDVEPATADELWRARAWHYLLIRNGLRCRQQLEQKGGTP